MQHLRCGDDILDKLRAAVPGVVYRWLDPLCEGPVPGHLDRPAFRAVRATWLAARYGLEQAGLQAILAGQDDAVAAAAGSGDELVLWVDHTLFDQLILIRLLDWLWPLAAGRLSLICIDRHPDLRRFISLGQLAAPQLAALLPRRCRVTDAQAGLATWAWQAFSAATPEPLEQLVAGANDWRTLPFLKPALDRHRRQYPWRSHGLAHSTALALRAVARGAVTPHAVFAAVQAAERAPWQGQAMISAELAEVMAEPNPLLTVTGGTSPEAATLALTEQGRAVLDGRRCGLDGRRRDRWLGGVHLTDDGPDWRWDDSVGLRLQEVAVTPASP